jgi:hypothetical protein
VLQRRVEIELHEVHISYGSPNMSVSGNFDSTEDGEAKTILTSVTLKF